MDGQLLGRKDDCSVRLPHPETVSYNFFSNSAVAIESLVGRRTDRQTQGKIDQKTENERTDGE